MSTSARPSTKQRRNRQNPQIWTLGVATWWWWTTWNCFYENISPQKIPTATGCVLNFRCVIYFFIRREWAKLQNIAENSKYNFWPFFYFSVWLWPHVECNHYTEFTQFGQICSVENSSSEFVAHSSSSCRCRCEVMALVPSAGIRCRMLLGNYFTASLVLRRALRERVSQRFLYIRSPHTHPRKTSPPPSMTFIWLPRLQLRKRWAAIWPHVFEY